MLLRSFGLPQDDRRFARNDSSGFYGVAGVIDGVAGPGDGAGQFNADKLVASLMEAKQVLSAFAVHNALLPLSELS